MGNGQFGIHIVETPKVDRAIGPPSIPIEHESVLFKKEYYPHVTTSTYISPVKGTFPVDYANRPFASLPQDGTLGGGCSSLAQYSSVQNVGQKYESSSTSTHSSFLSSCTGNYGSPVSSSYPASRKTTTSGFPEIRRLGQRYSPYYKNVADDFHLRYKEHYSNQPTTPQVDPGRNGNMQHTPPSYEVNVDNMVNNNLVGKMSSLDFCCDQYTTPSMVKLLRGTEAGKLIARVCGGGPLGNSPYNGTGRRYGSGTGGRPISKGAQTTPFPRMFNHGDPNEGKFIPVGRNGGHFTPPGAGFETKESQTPSISNFAGQTNPNVEGKGNHNPKKSDDGNTPKKSLNEHNNDNDGDRWIDDPYGHGENEDVVPNDEKVPDDSDKNVNDRPNKGDNRGSGTDGDGGNKIPNGAGGFGTKVPTGKLYPGGVPNWLSGGDPMGDGDVDSPTKPTAPPKPTNAKTNGSKPSGKEKKVGGNNNKKKSQPRLKKNLPKVENENHTENKEKQPSVDSSKNDPVDNPEIPASTLYPTWSDGQIIQPDPELSKPRSVPVRNSLPANNPRTSDADKRRKTDPTKRSSIPIMKQTKPRQSMPVLKADRQSLARLKEILSRSFSGPVPGRRHSDPTPETGDNKRRLNKNKKAQSVPELKLDNLPLTPTADLSIITGGRKNRRRSSTDDPPPPPPPRPKHGPSWFDVMSDEEEKKESSHPRKNTNVHFTGPNKPQQRKSSLKKSVSRHGPPPRVSSSTTSSRGSNNPTRGAKTNNPNDTKKKSIRFTGVPPTP